jgi:predicted SprT family Zn-dependent metalloprotease
MFYGCYGYYDYPDKIFVNINAKIDFILETIIHELIHLFVYEKSQNMKYQEIENLVDSIIIKSGLKNIFTKYEKQIIN